MKSLYTQIMHTVGAVLDRLGLLRVLDIVAARSRTGVWLKSLVSIYDLRGLVELDVPWWTFRSADVVEQHLATCGRATVFEWGSGASTVWLSARASEVTAIEHDPSWAEQVRPLVGPNVRVVTVEPVAAAPSHGVSSNRAGFAGLDFTDYVQAIQSHPGEFDLIVIDGRAREACLPLALQRLAADGLIVFDNVDRRRYRKAIGGEPDIEVLMTRGLTPTLPYPTRTALIRKSPRP